jgi:hypothetical protein
MAKTFNKIMVVVARHLTGERVEIFIFTACCALGLGMIQMTGQVAKAAAEGGRQQWQQRYC